MKGSVVSMSGSSANGKNCQVVAEDTGTKFKAIEVGGPGTSRKSMPKRSRRNFGGKSLTRMIALSNVI